MCRILVMTSKKPISSSFLAEFRLLAEKGMISLMRFPQVIKIINAT